MELTAAVQYSALNYYHPNLDSTQAKQVLASHAIGAFLLRSGQSHTGLSVTLSAANNIKNYAIRQRTNGTWLLENANPREFPSLRDLIEHYRTHPLSSREDTCLWHPVAAARSSRTSSTAGEPCAYTQLQETGLVPQALAHARRVSNVKEATLAVKAARCSTGQATRQKDKRSSDSQGLQLQVHDVDEYTLLQEVSLVPHALESARRASSFKEAALRQQKQRASPRASSASSSLPVTQGSAAVIG